MKEGQKPAFPRSAFHCRTKVHNEQEGMSTRLVIAKDAMCAIISANKSQVRLSDPLEPIPDPIIVTKMALAYTDALLKQEEK